MRESKVGCLLLAALLAAGCGGGESARSEEVVVFAAASLTDALEALADSFEAAHPGRRVVVNPAASSLLARQLAAGAEADLYISANEAWMDYLVGEGRVAGPVRRPLGGRLVVVGRRGAPPLESIEDLARAERLALADPAHVPAGIYAREALECLGLWERVEERVVPALDVRAALLAVRSGAADLGIVYVSDARIDTSVQVLLAWPARCAPEVRYAAARLREAPNPAGAERFLAFLTDPARAALWRRFGFEPRTEPAAP